MYPPQEVQRRAGRPATVLFPSLFLVFSIASVLVVLPFTMLLLSFLSSFNWQVSIRQAAAITVVLSACGNQ